MLKQGHGEEDGGVLQDLQRPSQRELSISVDLTASAIWLAVAIGVVYFVAARLVWPFSPNPRALPFSGPPQAYPRAS